MDHITKAVLRIKILIDAREFDEITSEDMRDIPLDRLKELASKDIFFAAYLETHYFRLVNYPKLLIVGL